MGAYSLIEWTETTWNPVTGCSKISVGCKNCYAERMAKRLHAMGQPNYSNGFKVTVHNHVLNLPLKWNKSRIIFVNSMSDLFHERVPAEFIFKVFDVMRQAKHHCFQILTKRTERLLELKNKLVWAPNIWMGVSVENEDCLYRVAHLQKTEAEIKFLSLEPLLGPLANLNLKDIDWVIVGGESGPQSRTMEQSWVIDIRDQCQKSGVPFFFKQWGGFNKKKAGRKLEGKTWEEMPDITKVIGF